MKRKTSLLALLSFIIVLTLLLSCCNSTSIIGNSSKPENESTYEQKIEILESQILLLMQTYELSESEYKLQINKLQEEITNLKELTSDTSDKNEDTPSTPPVNDDNDTSTEAISPFTYTVSDGKAIITGYTGQDERLVIPTSIDGYTVIEIADSAIKSSTIKDIIISTSVIKIGWFAFSDCTKLKTITIPQSVEKIGYSAFGNTNKSITIYCYDNSFAQSYAQSYGFAYKLL